MKKAVVIPYDIFTTMQNNQPIITQGPSILNDPSKEKILRLERELRQILDSDLNSYDKRSAYVKVFQELLEKLGQFNDSTGDVKTNQSAIQDSLPLATDVSTDTDRIETWLERALPQTLKTKGMNLYKVIKEQDGIEWNFKDGEISVDGTVLKGSNIIDLVSDLTRQRKTAATAGWNIIANKFKNNNFPRTLIANKTRLKDIENPAPVAASTPSISTPPDPKTRSAKANKTRSKPYPTVQKLRRKSTALKRWLEY